jgi:hypothetical protein
VSWAKGVTRILWPSYVLSYPTARTRKPLVLLVIMHQLRLLRRAVGYGHSVHTGHGKPQHLPTHKGSCVTPDTLKQHKIKLFYHKPRYLTNGVATAEVTWKAGYEWPTDNETDNARVNACTAVNKAYRTTERIFSRQTHWESSWIGNDGNVLCFYYFFLKKTVFSKKNQS